MDENAEFFGRARTRQSDVCCSASVSHSLDIGAPVFSQYYGDGRSFTQGDVRLFSPASSEADPEATVQQVKQFLKESEASSSAEGYALSHEQWDIEELNALFPTPVASSDGDLASTFSESGTPILDGTTLTNEQFQSIVHFGAYNTIPFNVPVSELARSFSPEDLFPKLQAAAFFKSWDLRTNIGYPPYLEFVTALVFVFGSSITTFQDDQGETLMHYAARLDDVEAAEAIYVIWEEMHARSEQSQYGMQVNPVLDQKNKSHCTPLQVAVINDSMSVLEVMMRRTWRNPFDWVDGFNSPTPNIPLNVVRKFPRSLLHLAIHNGRTRALRFLLRSALYASPDTCDEEGMTLLHHAMTSYITVPAKAAASMVKACLDLGCSPLARTKTGLTPLALAIHCGRRGKRVPQSVILAVLTHGSAQGIVDATTVSTPVPRRLAPMTTMFGTTVPQVAPKTATLLELVLASADDLYRRTPLQWACAVGDIQTVKLLTSFCKHLLELRDCQDRTAVLIAAAAGHTEIENFLIESGAHQMATDMWEMSASDIRHARTQANQPFDIKDEAIKT
ncbi:ankyrin repeat-containing domain protein [Gaertneriomyces semiglobifer]|nr:ankyrin repeat-containing domain protein [Gaertneriomyces semiglobifer]